MPESDADAGAGVSLAPRGKVRFPTRERAALRTREAIITAAFTLFSEIGYSRTTMRSIAAAAGVSVESVNLAGPKRALLAAAFSVTFAGDEGDESLTDRPALAQILAMPGLKDAVSAYVDLITSSIARSAGIWAAIRTAASEDDEVREMFEGMLQRRRNDIGQGASWLVSRGVVPPNALEEVTASLSVIVAHETYEHLVGQFGWSMDRYRRWVETAIEGLIIPPRPNV